MATVPASINKIGINKEIEKYKYLVYYVIDRLNITIPSGLTRDDIYSYGLTGLFKGLKTYDSNKGSLKMYLKCKIYNEIIDNIRAYSIIPRSTLNKKKQFQNAIKELENKLNRVPTKEEIIKYMQIDEEEYFKYIESLNYGIHFSLNDIFKESDDEYDGYLVVKNNDNIIEKIEEDELKRELIKLLENLPEVSKQIIYLYFYEKLTFKEIAYILNTSVFIVKETLNRTLTYLKVTLEKSM